MLITASFVYLGGVNFYEITVCEELPGYTLPS